MDKTPSAPLVPSSYTTDGSAQQNAARSMTSPRTTSLNDRLNTNFVNVGEDESSVSAKLTRTITGFVGKCVTPRHLLIILRILKAITFCFLILTLAADLMYIFFLEVMADKEVKDLAGGRRDMIIRIYGLFLAVVAICIELDYSAVVKSFYGFKGFIPRAMLLFFVSAITGSHPLHSEQAQVQKGDDDAAYDDVIDDAYYTQTDIPQSAVVFQMVTSFILGICAVTYFVFGCLCLDRFTSKAFLSTNDPIAATAIPRPSGVQPMDADAAAAYRNPDA